MIGDDGMEVHTVLDMLKFVATARVEERQLFAARHPQMVVERTTDGLLFQLSHTVIAEKLPPATVEEAQAVSWPFPASPWQHWKRKHGGSWWLAWFVRRWPVRIEQHERTVFLTVSLERYRTFPESRLQLPDPDLGRSILYSRTEHLWGER